ncbi:movement protein [Eleusine indica associated virus]|uniref:Movement protein n=1 Tax=Eleusine indica associated virus TaxID=2596881 RepID=A0A516F3J3_9GEMI|nr:movement protein [Eleusine indica associated virus]QDO73333.1 movement protein [Eleusine indica associated virus]
MLLCTKCRCLSLIIDALRVILYKRRGPTHSFKMGRASHYQVFTPSSSWVVSQSPPEVVASSDPWFRVIYILVISLIILGTIYLAYRWFIRDVVILFRAKRQRSTEEIGFGNTPARADGGFSLTGRGTASAAPVPPV